MNLDNALDLKNGLLTKVLGYDRLDSIASADDVVGVHRPALAPGAQLEADADSHRPSPELQISVGVTPPPNPEENSRYGVVVFYRHQRLRRLLGEIDAAAGPNAHVRKVFVGRIRTASGFLPEQAHRPLRIGGSVSHHKAPSGTLSCFVKLNGTSDVCLLSNHHVIATPAGLAGDIVVQPGRSHGGRATTHRVAVLETFVPWAYGSDGVNLVDCAVARIVDGACVGSQLGRLPDNDRTWPDGDKPPVSLRAATNGLPPLGQPVWKYGLASGWTQGEIVAFEVTTRVAVRVSGARKAANFDGQIVVQGLPGRGAFAKRGDSGSPVVLPDGTPIGLVFAISDKAAITDGG